MSGVVWISYSGKALTCSRLDVHFNVLENQRHSLTSKLASGTVPIQVMLDFPFGARF